MPGYGSSDVEQAYREEITQLQQRAEAAERERDRLAQARMNPDGNLCVDPGVWQQLRQRADAAEARLAGIEAAAKADAADLEKMRDGTKLTRSGVVECLVYWKEECAAATRKLEALREVGTLGERLVDWLKQDEDRQVLLQYEYESTERLAIYLRVSDGDTCETCLNDRCTYGVHAQGATLTEALENLLVEIESPTAPTKEE